MHPATTNECVLQITTEALVTCTREHPNDFETGELEAARLIANDYYEGRLGSQKEYLDRATKLADQGPFKAKGSAESSSEQSRAYLGFKFSGNQAKMKLGL